MTTHLDVSDGGFPERIQIDRGEQLDKAPEEAMLAAWAEAALVDWVRPVPIDERLACVSIQVVGVDESQALNNEWRGHNRPTNVLSFPADVAGFLGDVVLCAPVIEREAIEQGKPSRAHWAHLVVHGVLHLRGHDHDTPASAARMERKEVAILAQLGFSDPYEVEWIDE